MAQLRELEQAVVEATIAYFKSQHDWTERNILDDFAGLYDKMWGAVDALLAHRKEHDERVASENAESGRAFDRTLQ